MATKSKKSRDIFAYCEACNAQYREAKDTEEGLMLIDNDYFDLDDDDNEIKVQIKTLIKGIHSVEDMLIKHPIVTCSCGCKIDTRTSDGDLCEGNTADIIRDDKILELDAALKKVFNGKVSLNVEPDAFKSDLVSYYELGCILKTSDSEIGEFLRKTVYKTYATYNESIYEQAKPEPFTFCAETYIEKYKSKDMFTIKFAFENSTPYTVYINNLIKNIKKYKK